MASLDERMTPPLEIKWEIIQSQGVKILRFQIPKGADRPYCVDDYKYYVRDEAETTLAVRDELVALVRESLAEQGGARSPQDQPRERNGRAESQRSDNSRGDSNRRGRGRNNRGPERPAYSASVTPNGGANKPVVFRPPELPAVDEDEVDVADLSGQPARKGGSEDAFYLPQIGVEIVATEDRNGNKFHSIRDLRNGHVIHNVTRKGARKLWSYAIQQHEDNPGTSPDIEWQGDIGLVGIERRAGKVRYDLALRADDKIRIFYGVTEDGMEGPWSVFVQDE
jgi:hypothetical protein